VPDQSLTKREFASVFREMLKTEPFRKISVGDLCEKCGLNRKSFYYHFKDKYDLVNWIFYTEFVSLLGGRDYENGWDLMDGLCAYFYENRDFYRKVLSVDGQNSFREYFKEILEPLVRDYLQDIVGDRARADFFVDFYAEAIVSAVVRWLTDKKVMTAGEFMALTRECVSGVAAKIVRDTP